MIIEYKDMRYIINPPGEMIQKELENRGITNEEAAKALKMSERDFEFLLEGQIELTEDMAKGLEKLFDIRASFFMGLEKVYRNKLSKIETS